MNIFQASYRVVILHEALQSIVVIAVKTLCSAVLPVSASWEDVQSEPFLLVISDEVASCEQVLATPLLSSSDLFSLLILAINVGLTEDEIEEPTVTTFLYPLHYLTTRHRCPKK